MELPSCLGAIFILGMGGPSMNQYSKNCKIMARFMALVCFVSPMKIHQEIAFQSDDSTYPIDPHSICNMISLTKPACFFF